MGDLAKDNFHASSTVLEAAGLWYQSAHNLQGRPWYEAKEFTFGGEFNLITTHFVHALESEKISLADAVPQEPTSRPNILFRYCAEDKAQLHLALQDLLDVRQHGDPSKAKHHVLDIDPTRREILNGSNSDLKTMLTRIAVLDCFMEHQSKMLHEAAGINIPPQEIYAHRQQLDRLIELNEPGAGPAKDLLLAQEESSKLTKQFTKTVEMILGKPLFVRQDNVVSLNLRTR